MKEVVRILKLPKKESMRNNLLILISIYTLLFLSAIIFYLCRINKIGLINKNSFLITTFAIFLIFIFTMFLFVKNIFFPILNLEKIIKLIEGGDIDFGLDLDDNDKYPFTDSLNKMLKRLKDSMNREYMAKILKKQAEINSLQSQINPHFLYNTLESIRGQALVEGADEIAEMTEALSTIFRYSISKKGNLVLLRDEIKNVKNYFLIQQFRFNNKFNLLIIYDEENEEVMDYMLPKLTIQPIVENSICHGLEKKMGKGNIEIRITCTKKRVIINISDDGIGIDKALLDEMNMKLNSSTEDKNELVKEKHTGIALFNVNERIKLYFGDDFGITVSSTRLYGTDVEIIIPVIRDEEELKISDLRKAYEK